MMALAGLMGPLTYRLVHERAASQARILALEPAESRLTGLLTAATGHSVIATDLDGLITVFNPGAEAMLGWSSEEMVGQRTPAVVHDPAEVAARAADLGLEPGFAVFVQEALRGGQETRDWTYVRRDGGRLDRLADRDRHPAPEGALTGYIGIATDVTDVAAPTVELNAQQAIHRLLIGNLPDTVRRDDRQRPALDHRHRRAVAGGARRRGERPRRPATGESQNMVNPDALRAFLRAGAAPARCTETSRRSTRRCSRSTRSPSRDPEGEPLCLVVTRDVTEQRRTEQLREEMMIALGASEERFRNTFEDAPIGIALRTVGAGDDDTRFLQVEPRLRPDRGRRPGDLAGTRVADLEHPEEHLGPGPTGLVRLDGGSRRATGTRRGGGSGRGELVWFVRDATGRASTPSPRSSTSRDRARRRPRSSTPSSSSAPPARGCARSTGSAPR